ncbi:MAG TPA: alpha/beta hydrolase [Chloroflexi bacterium]|nr:alpha/beta hydrolase [Chloroflexota bacterium]HHW87342.1 alpha/beta hydrolase [Chloroflexota bacterium]
MKLETQGNAHLRTTPTEQWIVIRHNDAPLRLHVWEWSGTERPFVLLHGLASNATTWWAVGNALAAQGHRVIAVDQRGHGRSDKPEAGYDFATITDDLHFLLQEMAIDAPVIAGQSWGGNVVLAYGARHPLVAQRLILVDGGFLDLQARPGMSWERVASELRPPSLAGALRQELAARIQAMHPDWTAAGVAATLNNFETLPDGTVRPWLTLERHMAILRALWEQRPSELYPLITCPVTIVVAEDANNPEWMAAKRSQVAAAEQGLAQVRVHWLPDTAHDIHVHRPVTLAALMQDEWEEGR